jgi:hypothetical protein
MRLANVETPGKGAAYPKVRRQSRETMALPGCYRARNTLGVFEKKYKSRYKSIAAPPFSKS